MVDTLELNNSAMDPLQEQFEKAVGDSFFEWLNSQIGAHYSFTRRAGQAPDLVYMWDGKELFVEVTGAYYDGSHAAFLWKSARGTKDAPAGWTGVNASRALAMTIFERIAEKSKNRYGERTVLLVNVPPGVTSAEELSELLLKQSFPLETPFVGIYVVGNFPITTHSSGGYRVIPIKELPALLLRA